MSTPTNPSPTPHTYRQVARPRLGAGGSLQNIMTNTLSPNFAPAVGMGATVCMYTDRHAYTIVEVSPRCVVVQADKAIRTDNNGMSEFQAYRFEPDPSAERIAFTLRKDGRWVKEGESLRNGSVLTLGIREEYYDYSF